MPLEVNKKHDNLLAKATTYSNFHFHFFYLFKITKIASGSKNIQVCSEYKLLFYVATFGGK